ncbi:MAG: hypothetical protein ABI806_08835 [Candidatus Solibacter sp.]
MANSLDKATLEAALIGYQHQVEDIQAKIAAIRKMLTGNAPTAAPKVKRAASAQKQKHKMSAEGRARIAAAQRARWAKAKRNQ